MTVLRILFYAFLIYLAYRLVFNFIIPLYRTTRQVRRGIRAMHERMREADGQGAQPRQESMAQPKQSSSAGDYIDFEEVK